MRNTVHPLYRIDVESPCTADWNSMIGNDQVRFCEHCSLHVNNLDRISRGEALRLIAKSNGKLCVRFTLPARKPAAGKTLHRIHRRVSRLAAGAFTATLTVASAASQSNTPQQRAVVSAPGVNQPVAHPGGKLSGIVTDPAGEVVAGVNVTLVSTADHISYSTTTDDSGSYSFSLLSPGNYALAFEGAGFDRNSIPQLVVGNTESTQDMRLELPLIFANVEVVAPVLETQVSGGMVIVAVEHPLVKAAADNDLAAVQQLMYTVDDINVRDENTDTSALDHAVENGNYQILRVLLAAGASAKSTSKLGRTSLMHASESTTIDVMRALLAAGAKVNARDDSRETPLMHAAAVAAPEVVRVLTEAGARIESKSEDGKTPLMFAATNSNPAVTKLLLTLGAELEASDKDGCTPLLIASESGSTEVVKELLAARANVNATDHDGYTPLLNATYAGQLEAVLLLLEAGANISARTESGETAVAIAKRANNAKMVELLTSRGAPE